MQSVSLSSPLSRLVGDAVWGALESAPRDPRRRSWRHHVDCESTSTWWSCAAGGGRRDLSRPVPRRPPERPIARTASAIVRIDCCSCASTILMICSARGGRYSSAVRRSNARSAAAGIALGFDGSQDVGPPLLAALARLRRQLGGVFGGARQAAFRDVEVGQVSPQFIEDFLVDQDAGRVPVADVEDPHRPRLGVQGAACWPGPVVRRCGGHLDWLGHRAAVTRRSLRRACGSRPRSAVRDHPA